MAITMRMSFREAVLATYDKEAADLRLDVERGLDSGELDRESGEPWSFQIAISPSAIRDLDEPLQLST